MIKIKSNSIVTLKNGLKGRVMTQLENGEYILANGKGGKITYFKEEDVIDNESSEDKEIEFQMVPEEDKYPYDPYYEDKN